jgi:hypothetical protein
MEGRSYVSMLDKFVFPIVSKWKNCEELHVMKDEAPHSAFHVSAWLEHFPRWWHGRWGLV